MSNDRPLMKANLTRLYNNTNRLITILSVPDALLPNISFTWLNEDTWSQILNRLVESLMATSPESAL